MIVDNNSGMEDTIDPDDSIDYSDQLVLGRHNLQTPICHRLLLRP